MIKIPCRVVFTPQSTSLPVEITGIVDRRQLTSQQCEWLTVESSSFRNHRIQTEESIIPKQDIVLVVLFKENRRYVIDKHNLALNIPVVHFLEKLKT